MAAWGGVVQGTLVEGVVRRSTWDRLTRLRRLRRVQSAMMIGLVVLGPLLALATFLALGPFGQVENSVALRLVLLADIVYFLLLAALVMARLARMIALGADAVLVGRPFLHAAAALGARGPGHLIDVLRAELETTMVQLGCARLSDLRGRLWQGAE